MKMKPETVGAFYDEIAEEYDKVYDYNFWKLYYEITWHYLQKWLPENKKTRILDAGGGTGKWAMRIANEGYSVKVIDISQNMLDVAERKIRKEKLQNRISLSWGDVTDLKFEDNYFDFVISLGDVISYCGNHKKAMKELKRVLKPGGILAVSVDSCFDFVREKMRKGEIGEVARFLKNGKTIDERFGKYRLKAFTPKELRELLEQNHMQVLDLIGRPVFIHHMPPDACEALLNDKKTFDELLRLEIEYSARPTILGFGQHLMAFARKQAV